MVGIIIVILSRFSLAAILAQWIASFVVWWLVGCAMPIPCHCVGRVGPREPNLMSLQWAECCGACEW